MSCKRNYLALLAFLAIILTVFLQLTIICEAQGPPGTGEPLGQVRRIKGPAIVQRAGSPEFQTLAEKNPVFLEDMIGTDPSPDARTWWKGSQAVQADASLGTASTLKFLRFQRERGASQFAGQVRQGIVRFTKRLPRTTPPSSFVIVTPTAAVAVTPTEEATDFIVEVLDENRTQITVNFGSVVVSNVSDEIPQQQSLTFCQAVVVERDKEPSAATVVTEDALRDLVKRTTISGTLSERVGNCKKAAAPLPAPSYPQPTSDPGLIAPPDARTAPQPPPEAGVEAPPPPPGVGVIPPPGPGVGVILPPFPGTGILPPPPSPEAGRN